MIFKTLIAFLALASSAPVYAQAEEWVRQTVTSDGPSAVSVTVYRNPGRDAANAMNLNYLGGYALITEQRTIDLPAGEVDLRFEGVAGGIIPQSAIVTGLPDNVIEKNRDAALLSPSALLNNYLGQGVTIRRTSGVTGATTEFDATIRTDASGGVVVQTADGFEALQCTGLNEAIIYPAIPEGLSAKPTLSIKSRVKKATRATVTLSYLATGFDWQANYVADISADGQTMNLFSWVTLGNGDETSFTDAQTQAVAGQPNKGRDAIAPATGGAINLACWPQGTTSDIVQRYERMRDVSSLARPAPPPPMAPMAMEAGADQIMVTGSRVMAKQEDLGDLKLYRIPEPVTVASKSQKQVAFLEKENIPFSQIYATEFYAADSGNVGQLPIIMRFQNEKASQLGIPLPAGKLVAFKPAAGTKLHLGEGSLEDKAIGEEVEVTIGESPLVLYELMEVAQKTGKKFVESDMELKVTNASKLPATIEIKIDKNDNEQLQKLSQKLGRKDGMAIWKVILAPNSEQILTYRVKRRQP